MSIHQTTMFHGSAAGHVFDERPIWLAIIVVGIVVYSCVTVTFGDDRGGVTADSLPNNKEVETEGPATCVFTSVDKDMERIVVDKLIYLVHRWYRLDTHPRRRRVQVYENTRAAMLIRDTSLTMAQIQDLRTRRTDPDDRVGAGLCWPVARVILVSELKSREVPSDDDNTDNDK